ncbi:hypothetical protein BH09CHL1_BH09CHL1_21230 [soil metagenome]
MNAALSNTWIRIVLLVVLGIAANRFISSQFDRFSAGWQLAVMSVFMLVLVVLVVRGVIKNEKKQQQRSIELE